MAHCGCEAWELPWVAVEGQGLLRGLVMFTVRVWVQHGPYGICEVVDVDGCGCEKGQGEVLAVRLAEPAPSMDGGEGCLCGAGLLLTTL